MKKLLEEKSITIAIVALNEEKLIEETVRSIHDQVKTHFSDYEIFLVNDGSTDRTSEIMQLLSTSLPNVKVINNEKNSGLGFSFQRALEQANQNYFMMLCGDGGIPAESLPPVFNAVGTVDIVIPHITNLNEIKTLPRLLLSKTYTGLMNFLFKQNLHYYNGLPIYKVYLLKQIKINSSGFGFQGEIITKLLKAGCSYQEIKTLGAEKSKCSKAISLRNFINVGKTFWNLVWDVTFFNPNIIKK